jgi:hypothetical protein
MRQLFTILVLSILWVSARPQTPTLQSFIKDYTLKHNFNGTILIKKDSKVVYHNSFGVANREFNVPFSNETDQ